MFGVSVRIVALLSVTVLGSTLRAGEWPYFITYTHQMEEPGNLEIATRNVTGKPARGNRFLGSATELEYGVTGWWTTELYMDAQSTRRDSTLFTGYRWENRFRVLPREHWINPVLYIEFENINGADKSLLETVNHDGQDDLTGPNAEARLEKKRELEAKLILSSNVRVITTMPAGGVYRRIRRSVGALLKLSDSVVARAGLADNMLGGELPACKALTEDNRPTFRTEAARAIYR
jgi:hypothetical protein